ncbi:serine threonineprotein phosphatase 4 catalytic subunit [Plasmopara halstedii]|uniref:Serine threonineprotein phosphatase 4 catalytic subunit n=1 Tax=Plasmopara halstedii TaxID=4781 RepID=A0A0P1AAI1_PLAHL|nr:serine threonineprotein phosphatase 4 catalytic subunit [Plasmopara halstedii]CEG37577.1 serine threonineprotein phosphatase 4 catalytic subunit [Plasmopara halstedii]|eukprot:XP_024573946.1 serine threonineprotein phosphatase 4 catalytic subunit [Plasmopara halstedii]
MANVMLTSEAAKDPNKPFAVRVEDVCTKFDELVSECLTLVQFEEQPTSNEGEIQTSMEDQVVKKLEQFNSVCDELYKEILRRKEKLLYLMEKSPKNVDLHRQIQTAGNLAQVVGDFRHFLETGTDATQSKSYIN